MSSIQVQLARSFKALQKLDNVTVKLIEENIDQWEVTYNYPNNTMVTLRLDFYLKEPLPPKVQVLFPANAQYVCFEELGTVSWKANNDVATLIYSLQNEFSTRGAAKESGTFQSLTDAHSQWKFVQGAHLDWKMIDVSELSAKLEALELTKLRQEGQQCLVEQQEVSGPQEASVVQPQEASAQPQEVIIVQPQEVSV